jgi:hypothetical protein
VPRSNGLSNASEKWQEYRVTKKSVAIQHEWTFEVEFSLGSAGANVRGMDAEPKVTRRAKRRIYAVLWNDYPVSILEFK